MLSLNLKYIIYLSLIICSGSLVTYIILNEKAKAKLELQKQIADIENATIKESLQVQKDIIINHQASTKKIQTIQSTLNNKLKHTDNIDVTEYQNYTIDDLNELLNCEINNMNNIDKICKK